MSDVTGFSESAAWTAETGPSADEVLEKQKLIREILSAQESLKALSTKATSVQADCTKAEADNEMLQNYIDSITKSLAAKGSGGGSG
ncbi:unnamed protein product [Jaminaea pallidilutea]